MYQYENGIKRKNVGFVRVEAKGGQCKITLHMQLLGQLDSIFPTYLIQRGNNSMELIYLGDTILKNQLMDSRLSADENNIMDSGFGLTEMSGILLFLNDKVFFATVWDDKPIFANEVLEALRPNNNRQHVKRMEPDAKSKESDVKDNQETIAKTIFKETPVNIDYQPEQTAQELKVPNYMLPGGWKMVERLQWPIWEAEKKKESVMEKVPDKQVSGIQESESSAQFTEFQSIPNQKSEEQNSEGMDLNTIFQEEIDKESQDALYKIIEDLNVAQYYTDQAASQEPSVSQGQAASQDQSVSQDQSADLNQAGGTFQPERPSAKHFFDNYPRIYPFEDNEITQSVKIEPKDIGQLPKELWTFSNNSFLMHGYYCYHHLIFAKMKNGSGYQYILGVPGIYHGREQFMARMFGFENFKSIKKRELKQGDFGYWYLPISL